MHNICEIIVLRVHTASSSAMALIFENTRIRRIVLRNSTIPLNATNTRVKAFPSSFCDEP